MTLAELLERKAELDRETQALDEQIRTLTELPDGWYIEPGMGLMAGGVTLCGTSDHSGQEIQVSICVYGGSQGSGFFIRDHDRGVTSPHVDPEAVKAAFRVFRLKKS